MFGVLIVKFVLNLRGRGLRIGDRGLRSALWCIEMVLVGENMLRRGCESKAFYFFFSFSSKSPNFSSPGDLPACPRKATQDGHCTLLTRLRRLLIL
jgi:hypothetical protein